MSGSFTPHDERGERNVLDFLSQTALERSQKFPDEEFMLRGLWRVDYRSQPNAEERIMKYGFLMAQTTHQGCCYSDFGSVKIDTIAGSLLGHDARTLPASNITERIAVLDAVFGSLCGKSDESRILAGIPSEKASQRAELVTAEVMRELDRCSSRRVANIGVMGNFIHHLRRHAVDVAASDLDLELVGEYIDGVKVVHGSRSLELVADSDVALVCGETLATETLDEIIRTAHANHTVLVIFAVSGCHFAEEYVRTFGVNVVISEPQPQYLFQGVSRIEIYRKAATGIAGTSRSAPRELRHHPVSAA
jgi:putative heavy-metal chelation protein